MPPSAVVLGAVVAGAGVELPSGAAVVVVGVSAGPGVLVELAGPVGAGVDGNVNTTVGSGVRMPPSGVLGGIVVAGAGVELPSGAAVVVVGVSAGPGVLVELAGPVGAGVGGNVSTTVGRGVRMPPSGVLGGIVVAGAGVELPSGAAVVVVGVSAAGLGVLVELAGPVGAGVDGNVNTTVGSAVRMPPSAVVLGAVVAGAGVELPSGAAVVVVGVSAGPGVLVELAGPVGAGVDGNVNTTVGRGVRMPPSGVLGGIVVAGAGVELPSGAAVVVVGVSAGLGVLVELAGPVGAGVDGNVNTTVGSGVRMPLSGVLGGIVVAGAGVELPSGAAVVVVGVSAGPGVLVELAGPVGAGVDGNVNTIVGSGVRMPPSGVLGG
eukprot:jgi/Tetstr1/461029/TSEL_006179.t1